MAAVGKIYLLTLWVIVLCVKNASTKIVEGTLRTKENWVFLAQYCFTNSTGELKYHFEYPVEYATQNVILYFDTQWPKVYPQEGMKCIDKEDKVLRGRNQVINLTSSYVWSGCVEQDVLGKKHFVCEGDRHFKSTRDRWWYIVLSNCKSTKGLLAKYRLEMTNGENACGKQFSADEGHIHPVDIRFFVLFIIVSVLLGNL